MGIQEEIPTPGSQQEPQKVQIPRPITQFFSQIKTWAPSQIPKAYPKTVPKIATVQKAKAEVAAPPIEVKSFRSVQLSKEAQRSLATLRFLGAQVNCDKITLTDVKKEYRKLAKIYHPDSHHPKAEAKTFHQCCLSYRQLSACLIELSKI